MDHLPKQFVEGKSDFSSFQEGLGHRLPQEKVCSRYESSSKYPFALPVELNFVSPFTTQTVLAGRSERGGNHKIRGLYGI
jgi:hypothetical protein